MNTTKNTTVLAAALSPGVHTYKGEVIVSVSGPHNVPKGRCVRIDHEQDSPFFGKTVVTTYVLALAQIPQV